MSTVAASLMRAARVDVANCCETGRQMHASVLNVSTAFGWEAKIR
jgi:hypothetical protein